MGHSTGFSQGAWAWIVTASVNYESEKAKQEAEIVGVPLRALTEEEIKDLIVTDLFNWVKNDLEADFDFVEIHGTNGFLVEQFIQPSSNHRTDK